MLILVVNGIVAIYQDQNAENALEALMEMQAQTAHVLRDGKEEEIEATDLVPGDLVKVVAGNCIPADLRIVNVMSVAL